MNTTQCSKQQLFFSKVKSKNIISSFDGDAITSEAGLLLLRETDKKYKIIERMAHCFVDYRDQRYCEHSLEELLRQRVLALCAGHEDLIDHDSLREDELYSLIAGKEDVSKKIAGKSTLNRLEKSQSGCNRYCKIEANEEALSDFLVEFFLSSHQEEPEEIVIDFDATDVPLHGHQENKFFHGYYDSYCYLPLYATCNDFVLLAKLRPSDIDASKGTLEELQRIVGLIRKKWPNVRIIVRGDSGFCRKELMQWIEEADNMEYIFGIARNSWLEKNIQEEMEKNKAQFEATGEEQRTFVEFMHQPLDKNWGKERRVIAKVEYLSKGKNPRFIITSMQGERRGLYEEIYCQRGDMENRIKEQQLDLFAGRMSCHKMKENQLRLFFSAIAYNVMHIFRVVALKGTSMAKAQCGTIREKLLKIGAMITISCRRIYLSLSKAFVWKEIFLHAGKALVPE